MKSSRIIIVAPYDLSKVGGVERFIISFAEAAREFVGECVIYNPFGFTHRKVNCIREIDEIEYDLCITHAIYGLGSMPKARRRIHTFHGTTLGNLFQRPWLWMHPKFWQWLAMESASRREKNGVVGVSDWAIKEIYRMGYRGPIKQIPSGGGFESQRIKSPRKPSLDGELVCVFCGRSTDKVKRFPMILEGFRLAHQKNDKIKLLVIGGCVGKVESGVQYFGNQSYRDALNLLNAAHVQINASYYEGYSLSLSEGIFQSGLITLATPVGGNLNTLIHGKTGFLFNSPRELATYLTSLAKNIELQKVIFNNIYDQMPIFSWEKVAEDTLKFAFSLPEDQDIETR